MKVAFSLLSCAALLVLAGTAQAAPLTAHQCNSYPFVRTTAPITQHQLQRELGELESVGYHGNGGDTYPHPLHVAQRRLMAKYQRDCVNTGLAHQAMPMM